MTHETARPEDVPLFTDADGTTDRTRTAEALVESEARYRRLFEAAKDGILILDADSGTIVDVNPFLVELLGYSRETFLGLRVWDLGFFKDIVASQDSFADLQRDEYVRYEDKPLQAWDGRQVDVEFVSNVYLVNHRKVIQCNIRDITERKRAKEALRRSEEHVRLLLDSIAEGLYAVDTDGCCNLVNRACLRMLGYDHEEELLGRHVQEVILHGATGPAGTGGEVREAVFWRRDGTSFPVECSTNPIIRARQTVGAVTSFFDVSGRKEVADSLARLATAVEQSAESIMITDVDATILYVNPAFEQASGFSRLSAQGRNARILASGKHDAAFYRQMWSVLTSGGVWRGHMVNRRGDNGELYEDDVTISPVRDAAGRTINYVAARRDVSRETTLEARLHQAQKMESVGRLAGGVAHDFNNMLGVILGHAELALDQLDPSQTLYADIQQIHDAARRSADLTRQLLAFARKQTVTPKVIDLNETVAGMRKMLQRLIGEDIDLCWQPADSVWPIRIDPSQIDQILANLCVNARDAIVGIGRMVVETSNTTIDDTYCASHAGCVPGDYVRLAVSDTGCGMAPATLDHIFEPFFTTKEVGQGTGLGLATVYGIVKQNSGFIDVVSGSESGTAFAIHFPRYGGDAGEAFASVGEHSMAVGHETILLVEDEPAILATTRRMLEQLGYTVLTASSPGAAASLARDPAVAVHLLVTDVVMPKMNGRDLARDLQALHPGLKCLLMSGYTADVLAHNGVLDEGVHFVQKPFSMNVLASKVRDALDAPA